MSKIKFYITTLLFAISSICFAQKNEQSTHRCVYNISYVKDTTTMQQGKEDLFIVEIGRDFTKGYSYDSFVFDSLLSTPAGMRYIADGVLAGTYRHNSHDFSLFRDAVLYKNYKTNKLQILDKIDTSPFVYEDELKSQTWEIQHDTLTIQGYLCQKATCYYRGRNYEAWFTPEIPISEGPWKFFGLPGLIVKIYDTQRHYDFELAGFQKSDKIINMTIPGKPQKISRKKFLLTLTGDGAKKIVEANWAKVGVTLGKDNKVWKYYERKYDYIEKY